MPAVAAGGHFTSRALLTLALDIECQAITLPACNAAGVEVLLRRDDLLMPALGGECCAGNKIYKLWGHLREAQKQGKDTLVSFGGAYSNHLYALAAAGQHFGLKTRAFIRGAPPAQLSPTLLDAEAMGMQLVFITRQDYRAVTQQGEPCPLAANEYFIPEGGSGPLGSAGAGIMSRATRQRLKDEFDVLCVPVGTGGTLAGAASELAPKQRAVGFCALKAGPGPSALAAQLANNSCRGCWRLIWGFHGGGYAKRLPPAMLDFCQNFEAHHRLLLDPVYTVKMLWGINELAKRGYWRKGSRIVAVHTGGVQGRRGFLQQLPASVRL